MKCIDRLRERVGYAGATLDSQGDCTLILDSAPGYVWEFNGDTALTESCGNFQGQRWIGGAVRELTRQASYGMLLVVDPKQLAKIRFELGDDDWGAPDGAASDRAV